MPDVETMFFVVLLVPIATLFLIHIAVAIYGIITQKPWSSACGQIETAAWGHDGHDGPFITIRFKYFIDDQPYWGSENIRVREPNTINIKTLLPTGRQIRVQYNAEDPEYQSRLHESERVRIKNNQV